MLTYIKRKRKPYRRGVNTCQSITKSSRYQIDGTIFRIIPVSYERSLGNESFYCPQTWFPLDRTWNDCAIQQGPWPGQKHNRPFTWQQALFVISVGLELQFQRNRAILLPFNGNQALCFCFSYLMLCRPSVVLLNVEPYKPWCQYLQNSCSATGIDSGKCGNLQVLTNIAPVFIKISQLKRRFNAYV